MKIDRLKNKILQLAIQGKLVPQNSNDEPASWLIQEIHEAKNQLIERRLIKKEKPLLEITDKEKPFDLPTGWEWTRLGNLFHIVRGSSPRPKGHPKFFTDKKTEYHWVTIKDITQFCKNNILSETIEYLTYEGSLKSRFMVKGEIIIAVSGSIGKTAIMGIDGYIYDGLAGLKTIVDNSVLRDYIFLFLNSWKEQLNYMSEGTSIQNINTDKLNNLVVPLPPLSEQKKIVEKSNEIFMLIDELDNNQADLLQTIVETKNKLLKLSVQGKLVKQNEKEEPASVLLEEIKKERNRLVSEKKIKKEKPLDEISDKEKLFELPTGWEWIRFGDIAFYKKGPFGSSITKSMFVPKSVDSVKVYEQKNAIQKESGIGDYYVTKEKYGELKSFEVFPGDIIVSCAGTIGETYIMPDDMEKGIINQALMRITLSECVNKEFYLMYFKYILSSQITGESKGSAIKNIPPLAHLKNIVFPLPPKEEQKRIVAKYDSLMGYFIELENLVE